MKKNTSFLQEIEKNLRDIKINSSPALPLEQWNPPFCGDIDMRIDQDGKWFYMKTPIGRQALVRLFAKILKKDENGKFYLVTPVEKIGIKVDNVPFVVVAMQKKSQGKNQKINFITNVGDVIEVGEKNRMRFQKNDQNNGMIPYVTVRAQLEAVVSRAVFYDLIDIGEECIIDETLYYGIWSNRIFFPIQPSSEVFAGLPR